MVPMTALLNEVSTSQEGTALSVLSPPQFLPVPPTLPTPKPPSPPLANLTEAFSDSGFNIKK